MKAANKKARLLLPLLTLLLIAIAARPELTYAAAGSGLSLWWRVIAPALLPFFIVSELLLECGLAAWIGPPAARLMGPLFRLPGAAALAVVMGFCSGFPTGAAVTASLRRQGAVSREQAERLIAFTNNAGPLYITVSVSAGLLGHSRAGLLLLLSHYGTNMLIGLGLGLWAALRREGGPAGGYRPGPPPTLLSIGGALKNAAQRAAGNILIIGCYMVFFSVLIAMLGPALPRSRPLLYSLSLGLFEMSLGIDGLARCGLPLARILPWTAALLSFGGLSVHTQVLAMIADTDIRPWLYFLCRGLQALLSYAAARLLTDAIALPAAALPAGTAALVSNLAVYWVICGAAVLMLLAPEWPGRRKK